MDVLKVSAKSNPNSVAGALAGGESEADARAKAGLVADALTITVE